MSITFQQTDTAAVCGAAVYCSASSLNSTQSLRQATVGGTPGVTAVTQKMDSNLVGLIAVFFECIVPSGATWSSGTWTVNIDVTGTSGFITWRGVDICRISSGCANQASIASSSVLIAFDTTGIKTTTLSGSAQTPAAGDKVMVLLSFINTFSTKSKTFGYVPDVTIVSPFVV